MITIPGRVLAVILSFLAFTQDSIGEDRFRPAGQPYSGPLPQTGLVAGYQNDSGTYVLAGKNGIATRLENGRLTISRLEMVRAASIPLPQNNADQGMIYKDIVDPYYLFFSIIPRQFADRSESVHWIYYSVDGVNFTRIITNSGTKRFDLDTRSIDDVRAAFAQTSSATANNDPHLHPDDNRAPDGKKMTFPQTFVGTADGGSAEATIYPEGIVKIHVRGHHSGVTGSTKYSCIVILSGFHEGQDFVVLNKPDTETLTVGANAFRGDANKDKDFTQTDAFKLADRENIRHVRVILTKNKSGENFVDTMKSILQATSELFDETEMLYKKIKSSEIGQDAATAAAAG